MKKCISMLLLMCMLLSVLPSAAFAAEAPQNKDEQFAIVSKTLSAIAGEFNKIAVTNDYTQADFEKLAQESLTHESVVVTVKSFELTKSTETAKGQVKIEALIMCGETGRIQQYGKQIPVIASAEGNILTKDEEKIRQAIGGLKVDNRTTKEDILKAAENAVSEGVAVVLDVDTFSKATFEKSGMFIGNFTLTLNGESHKFVAGEKIEQLVRRLPDAGFEINRFEWEFIRTVNIERYNRDLLLLSVEKTNQDAANIRKSELWEMQSHTRPNGCTFDTVYPDDFVHRHPVGENICEGPHDRTPLDFVNSWMDSPGHKENILNPQYGFTGMGHSSNSLHQRNVQLFSARKKLVSWATSTGSDTFPHEEAMQSEYLILTDECGCVSYLPLDLAYMKREADGYSIKLDSDMTAYIKIDGIGAPETPDAKTKFTDVVPGSKYEDAVAWAVKANVTSGTSDTTFSPDATCTRGQVVTFLWRSAGCPEPAISQNPFDDVRVDDYFGKAVLWAVEEGITTGISATAFGPENTCTTAQVLTFLYRAMDEFYTPAKGDTAWEKYKNEYYGEAVAWASKKRMIDAFVDSFNPDSDASRADIVYYMYKGIDSEVVDTSGIRWDMPW